jgi:phosphoribosyl 1,2-cyclic phosphodiesterase
MEVKAFASSSKGNCYLISSDSTNILVDIGYSPTKVLKEVKPDALLITHYHQDHISGLEVFKKHCDCPIFFGESHWLELKMEAFTVSHDVEAYGYTITNEDGERVTIMLDSGIVTGEMQEQINNADKLIIESNYDERLLGFAPYSEELKERIRANTGHLSNQQTGEALRTCNAKEIYLAHLSEESNTMAYAKQTVERISGKTVEVFRR